MEAAEIAILALCMLIALCIHIIVWSKLCDRVTRLEALVKLLENEIKLIHEKDGEQNAT